MKNPRTKIKQPDFNILLARGNIERYRLAEDIGVSPAYITQISQGAAVGPKTRARLLDVLGCSFDDIFFIEGPAHR